MIGETEPGDTNPRLGYIYEYCREKFPEKSDADTINFNLLIENYEVEYVENPYWDDGFAKIKVLNNSDKELVAYKLLIYTSTDGKCIRPANAKQLANYNIEVNIPPRRIDAVVINDKKIFEAGNSCFYTVFYSYK